MMTEQTSKVALRFDSISKVIVAPAWKNRMLGRERPATILVDKVSGQLKSGKMTAIMGPSGAGKSTLLDMISGRSAPSNGEIIRYDSGDPVKPFSNYVEQDDALLGVLTVRETLYYSAKLSMPVESSKKEINERVDEVLNGLGLQSVKNNRIGTPIQRGISGGQKRRVTIGSALVAMPQVLFLDEPTSGLDIHTAYEVMKSIASFAQKRQIAICATIHSPNWDIFSLFEDVLLLAEGKTIYNGKVNDVVPYLDGLGAPCPRLTNPADHMLRIVGHSFEDRNISKELHDEDSAVSGPDTATSPSRLSIAELHQRWKHFEKSLSGKVESAETISMAGEHACDHRQNLHFRRELMATTTLARRNFINYRRNLLAYGVRFAMYVGMGVLMATIWVHLARTDSRINDRISVHFFAVAFLGFMSVAGIPSFLEERGVMRRERFNGLYGPASFTLANTIVTLPFLFLCALTFAIISYWSIGLHPGASHFFQWTAFLYLGVLAAEMQSLLVAAILPIFVAALAIAAFLNGFWMTTQGYFIRTDNLPRFWYYWAHFINYETYALALLARVDLQGLQFRCVHPGQCAFPSESGSYVTGDSVVSYLQFDSLSLGSQVGIL
jgi:ABC-type multidrug transport system ATPase subunit/ABC-type multidrug transport system permease subunit